MKQRNQLTQALYKLEAFIPYFEKENSKISKSTVGWQIAHSLKVINGVIESLKTAPTTKNVKRTPVGLLCLTLGYIPRGKGKAPKAVTPPVTITKEDIYNQMAVAKENLNQIDAIHPKATFKHLVFGVLSKKTTLKFLVVHTKHHLKIVEDILK